jgi:ABC-type transport system involved in cytochrome c biogenesis permease component
VNPFISQFTINLKLHLRNKMALIYSYIFPTIFLVVFWVLYRFDDVPLVRHMGELLTVTALGGACFGLPTTMVSERERGVWRRYRLAPVSTGTLVAGTIAARYVLLLTAGLLQLALAMGIGMPMPRHPIDLFVAFTLVSFAFIGLGLVIAMMADNVPAVQALGQCVFLPMLVIGGVAVPLSILPEWAQRVSSFFPGRYAVEALQSAVTGDGIRTAWFAAFALVLIGAAASIAGAMMFRWDAQQRFARARGKGWVAAALAAWVVVGTIAETRIPRPERYARTEANPTSGVTQQPPKPTDSALQPVPPLPAETVPAPTVSKPEPAPTPKPQPIAPKTDEAAPPEPPPAPVPTERPPAPPPTSTAPSSAGRPSSWRAVTMEDIDRDLIFTRLPPDEGVVTPIARSDEVPDDTIATQLDKLSAGLPNWQPGKVSDPVQRVRNFLFVAAVPDVFQMSELEKFIPLVVYDFIQQQIPKDDLVKILYWIALHPFDGDDKAVDELRPLGLNNGPADMETTRDRSSVYAVKLLGRITGKITPQ